MDGVTHHTLHVVLTIAGAACEIVGLSWLVANASRERGAKYGEYGVFHRIWNWLVFWLSPPSEPVNLEVRAASSASASGQLSVRKGNETEIERLAREVKELRERTERQEAQTSQRFASLEQSIQDMGNDLRGRIGEVAKQQLQLHRSALRSDVRAGRVFILGAILSMVANLI